MKKHRIFSTLIESQKKSYELIMTSVLIAIGVNLLSTGIVELLGIQNKGIILIVIGMFISIGVVVRISTSKINELNQNSFEKALQVDLSLLVFPSTAYQLIW